MGRHNRMGSGLDQAGFRYEISYQPDWLYRVKVTRRLASGRRSTKILFRNPAGSPVEEPPQHVRIGIRCPEQGIDIEATVGPGVERVVGVRLDCGAPDDADPVRGRVALTLIPFRRPIPGAAS